MSLTISYYLPYQYNNKLLFSSNSHHIIFNICVIYQQVPKELVQAGSATTVALFANIKTGHKELYISIIFWYCKFHSY